MKTLRIATVSGIFLLPSLGCHTTHPGAEATGRTETVRALRYKRLCFESTLEVLHAAGTWHEELFFPEKGVRATLTSTSSMDENAGEIEFRQEPKLFAAYGELGNKLALSPFDKKETEQPTEEVRIPSDLARQIFELADLQKKMEEATARLGEKVEKSGALHLQVEPVPPVQE